MLNAEREKRDKERTKKQKLFVNALIRAGVPKKRIKVYGPNPLNLDPPIVRLNRETPFYPKGNYGNYGLYREYKIFNDKNLRSALKFYYAEPR